MSENGEEEAPKIIVDSESEGEDFPPQEPKVLTNELVASGLSKLSKTADGSNVAFVNLDLKAQSIESLGEVLRQYEHLRDVDVSGNKLKEVHQIASLPYLLKLNAARNQVESVMFLAHEYESLRFLARLQLSHNKITAVPEIPQANLLHLDLSNNQIETAREFKGHRNLKEFNLENNKLASIVGLANMPNLEVLNLTNNQITNLDTLNCVGSLKKLLLKNNPITDCNSFSCFLSNVTYLDLSNT
jgi:Leucine-rich repeat (LRR) protein